MRGRDAKETTEDVQECVGVAKLLIASISFHSLPFLIVYAGLDARFPPSRGTTTRFAGTTYANNVAVSGAMA